MNLAAFAVIVARERETAFGDDIRAVRGTRPRAAAARLAADDLDARPRRSAGDGRLHRQALPDRGPGRRRLHLARRLHRGRHDDLARLLPAGGGGDVDAPGGEAAPAARPRSPAPRRRPTRSTPTPAAAPTWSARRCSPPPRPSSSASSPSRWSSSPSTPAPRSSRRLGTHLASDRQGEEQWAGFFGAALVGNGFRSTASFFSLISERHRSQCAETFWPGRSVTA